MSEIASQMWCLARCLPFFIGEFIPENDQNWDNYLRLLTIMDHVFAPTTTSDKADYMEMLIEDFLAEFVELYPERRLTPKMHIMIHLPSWIKR